MKTIWQGELNIALEKYGVVLMWGWGWGIHFYPLICLNRRRGKDEEGDRGHTSMLFIPPNQPEPQMQTCGSRGPAKMQTCGSRGPDKTTFSHVASNYEEDAAIMQN